MSFGGIAVHCGIAYLLLLLMTRLRGKQMVAQATPFDFVLALVVGDLVDDLIWSEVATSQFVTAAGTLFLTDVIVAALKDRSARFYFLVNGRPRVVMTDGSRKRDEMRAEQLNEGDLDHLLRAKGYAGHRHPEIRKGVFEVDGHLSVIPHDWARELPKRELPKLRSFRK